MTRIIHANPSPKDRPKDMPRACSDCGSSLRSYLKVPYRDAAYFLHTPRCPHYIPKRRALEDKAAQAVLSRCPDCGAPHHPWQGAHCLTGCGCGEPTCPGEVMALSWLGIRNARPESVTDDRSKPRRRK